MIKRTLCGQCIALMKDTYNITENGRREKCTCDHCKKRKFGAECSIVPKKPLKH